STVASEDCTRLWSYLVEGGETNMARFADMAEALVSGTERPDAAEVLARAGIWWPGRGVVSDTEGEAIEARSSFEISPPSVLPDIPPSRREVDPWRSPHSRSTDDSAGREAGEDTLRAPHPISP